jgi:hypothetical protein
MLCKNVSSFMCLSFRSPAAEEEEEEEAAEEEEQAPEDLVVSDED